jgi:hypothetical protein
VVGDRNFLFTHRKCDYSSPSVRKFSCPIYWTYLTHGNNVIIGKLYGMLSLGYYTRAYNVQALPTGMLGALV